jgi:hypothetical protein
MKRNDQFQQWENSWRRSSPQMNLETIKAAFPDMYEAETHRTLLDDVEKYQRLAEKCRAMMERQRASDPKTKKLLDHTIRAVAVPLISLTRDRILKKLSMLGSSSPQVRVRMTEEDKARAKAAPIVQIAEWNGLHPRKIGVRFVILCPFHEERHPSCTLYPETNSFYCYGCAAGGDVIAFTKDLRRESFPETINYLNRL